MRLRKNFTMKGLTKQSFKNECDINMIMRRFKKTMNADYLSRFQGYAGGEFGDFSIVTDYRSALEQISLASDVFNQLPSQVRSRFRNDPAEFLDFCQNPANIDEMVSMGLATKRAPVQDAPSQPSFSSDEKKC